MRLSEVCDYLEFNKATVDQWINRGILVPDTKTVPGSARHISFHDALRIAILVEISDANMPVGALVKSIQSMPRVYGFKNDVALLVISNDAAELVPPTERGEKGTKAGKGELFWTPGQLWWAIVPAKEIQDYICNRKRTVSLIVNIDACEKTVRSFWPEDEL